MNRIAAIVAGLSLAFVGTSTSFAATINVPGDQPTIAAAISAASISGDTVLIAPGTYIEANLSTGGKDITVKGTLNADGSLATTIDAQQGGRVFTIGTNEGSGTVIRDLIITGGSEFRGGGIYCSLTSPTIRNCTITNNSAQNGGGIYCRGVSPSIIDCRITNNSSNGGPANTAGIHLWGSFATISGCTISENPQGGIFCSDYSSVGPQPTISDCSITGNAFGISCDSNGSPAVNGCTISDNNGMGIYCQLSSNPSISGCTIANNGGYGVYALIFGNFDSNPTLSGSIICGNDLGQLTGLESPAGSLVSDSCDIVGTTPGDVDGDGDVDTNDLNSLRSMLALCPSDISADGKTDIEDLLVLLAGYGSTTCP